MSTVRATEPQSTEFLSPEPIPTKMCLNFSPGDYTEDASMRNLKWIVLLAGAMTLSGARPALSHHSHAMFDHTKDVIITGNVMTFAYINPHGFLDIAVQDESGQQVKYWVEMSNLTNMVSRGITKTTFKPGDKVTVKLHPLRDGRPGGSYVTITAADGKTYD